MNAFLEEIRTSVPLFLNEIHEARRKEKFPATAGESSTLTASKVSAVGKKRAIC